MHNRLKVSLVAASTIALGAALGAAPANASEDYTNVISCSGARTWGTNFTATGDKLVRHTRTNGTYSQYRNDTAFLGESVYRNWGFQSGTWRNYTSGSFSYRVNQCD